MGQALQPTVSFSVEEAGGTTAHDLGIVGEFFHDYVGSDLDPRLTATSLVAELNSGNGFGLESIVMRQGDVSRTIDLSSPAIVTVQDLLDALNNSGLDVTASINATGRGIQITNNDPNRSLTIEDLGNGRAAKDMGIFGSGDMMGSLLVLINCLSNNDQEGTGLLLKNLDDAIQHLLTVRATAGARAINFETTASRLGEQELSFTELLSHVEDADLTKLITDLATYENSYRASLLATAKIIQPSLIDFLE